MASHAFDSPTAPLDSLLGAPDYRRSAAPRLTVYSRAHPADADVLRFHLETCSRVAASLSFDAVRTSLDNYGRGNLKRTLLVGVVLAAAAASPRLLWGIENYPADGVAGVIAPFVAPEDTAYAPTYTLNAWKRVRVGLSRSEVDSLLGPAQSVYPVDSAHADGAETGARWSYSPGDSNYRCRVLLFRNGIVVEKHSKYYFD